MEHSDHHHHHAHGRSNFRIQVILNTGDHAVSDFFRISYSTHWDNFFARVRLALCPELVPELTDCVRDRSGAHVFGVDVLTNGEVLYFCPRGERVRSEPHRHGLQPPSPTQNHQNLNFIQGAAAFMGNAGFGLPESGGPGFGHPSGLGHPDIRNSGFGLADLRSSGGFGLQQGSDFQQALGSIPPQSLPLSFPGPDGSQPPILPDASPRHEGGAVYFPSPVPPDEEPPYIPGQHGERKLENTGHAGHTGGNAGANVGGNTGLTDVNEHKPEGEIEEKAEVHEESKEKEPEKEESKQ